MEKKVSQNAKILQHNSKEFLADLRKVRDVLAYASCTGEVFRITKQELKKTAENNTIEYVLKDDIFVVKRTALVVY